MILVFSLSQEKLEIWKDLLKNYLNTLKNKSKNFNVFFSKTSAAALIQYLSLILFISDRDSWERKESFMIKKHLTHIRPML